MLVGPTLSCMNIEPLRQHIQQRELELAQAKRRADAGWASRHDESPQHGLIISDMYAFAEQKNKVDGMREAWKVLTGEEWNAG